MAAELETAQQRREAYLAAELRILSAGQEGTIATRRRREAELAEIRKAITELDARIASLKDTASGSSRLITVIPR